MSINLADTLNQWKSNPNVGIRLVAYGSSNTEMHWHSEGKFNWVAWLNASIREHIGKHVVIINQGIGGDTVKGLLNRFERDIIPLSPTSVIITIGGNDANRGISLEDYRTDLSSLITKIQNINATPILQTYYCPLFHKMGTDMQRFPEFVEVNRNIAIQFHIPIIDQYQYFEPFYRQNPKQYQKLMRDPLHVNSIGNYLMAKIACLNFGLPSPPISENHTKTHYLWMKMSYYCKKSS